LGTTRTEGGQRLIDGADLVRFLADTPRAPEPGAYAGQSARNRFAGIITKVNRDTVKLIGG
jgi:hypothetical protein